MRITISTELCAVLIEFADRIGIETDNLLKTVHLNKKLLNDTFNRIEIEKFQYLWGEIIESGSGTCIFNLIT